MSKIDLTLDLDWIDEYGNIDDFVKESIINNISGLITSDIRKNIEEEANKRIQAHTLSKIDDMINGIVEDLLEKQFTIYDDYGDVKVKNTTVKDQLKKRLDNFLEEKVDDNGSTTGYNRDKTRLEYFMLKQIDYDMQRKIDAAATEIKKGLERYIETTMKDKIGENVAKVIGLDKIMKKMEVK